MKINFIALAVLSLALIAQAKPIEDQAEAVEVNEQPQADSVEEVAPAAGPTQEANMEAAQQRIGSAIIDGQEEIVAADGDPAKVRVALARMEAKQKSVAEISRLQRTQKQELANPFTRDNVDSEAVEREVNVRRMRAPISQFDEFNDDDKDWKPILGSEVVENQGILGRQDEIDMEEDEHDTEDEEEDEEDEEDEEEGDEDEDEDSEDDEDDQE